jgi:hypothetical protein
MLRIWLTFLVFNSLEDAIIMSPRIISDKMDWKFALAYAHLPPDMQEEQVPVASFIALS